MLQLTIPGDPMLICANDFVKSSILCGLRGISFYFVTVFIMNFLFGEFLMLILIFQVSIPYFKMALAMI